MTARAITRGLGRLSRAAPIGLALLAAAPAALAADVSIEPPIVFVQPSETAAITVEVSGLTEGMAGFQVELQFDPAILAAADPNAGGPADPFEPPVWLLTSTGRVPVGVTSIDNGSGVVRIAYGTEPGAALPQGAGVLAQIEFTAVNEGVSDLTLAGVILADGQTPPQRLATALLDGVFSAVTGITDNDADLVPENVDGLGAPGDQACTGGASAGCDDNCPLLANTDQVDDDGNGLGDACQDGWVLSGTAAGGAVSLQVAGVDLVVNTTSGQSAESVAANIAAAINADAALASLGINALSSAGSVLSNAPILNRLIADPGLMVAVPIAPWVGGALVATLSLAGAASARRRERKQGTKERALRGKSSNG